jgi:hypothetical protein
LGKKGIFQGWEYVSNDPFEDAPQKGEFCIMRLVSRALVVGVAVAAVAVVVVVTGGAALIVVAGAKVAVVAKACIALCKAAAVGSLMASGGLAISDIRSGNNSSVADFFKVSLTGAITGAVGGVVGGKVACVVSKKLAPLLNNKLHWTGKALVGGVSGAT